MRVHTLTRADEFMNFGRQVRMLAAVGGVYARLVADTAATLGAPHDDDLKRRFKRWQKKVAAEALRRRRGAGGGHGGVSSKRERASTA